MLPAINAQIVKEERFPTEITYGYQEKLLEQALERNLLLFECRHRVYKLLLKTVLEIKIPQVTVSADAPILKNQALRNSKWYLHCNPALWSIAD